MSDNYLVVCQHLRAENDRLRGLLGEARPYIETQTEPPFRMGMNLLKRIDAALSPAPELQVVTTSTSQVCSECGKSLRQRLPKLHELAGRVYYEKCCHGRKEGKR